MTNSAIILNSISLEKAQYHLQRFFVHISTSFYLVSVFCQVSCLIAVVCYHSLTLSRSFSRLLAHSLTLLTHLLTCSLARTLSRSLIRSHYSLLYTLSHSAIQSFAHISHSFTHSLYSKTSLTHPRTNTPALTHSLTHFFFSGHYGMYPVSGHYWYFVRVICWSTPQHSRQHRPYVSPGNDIV